MCCAWNNYRSRLLALALARVGAGGLSRSVPSSAERFLCEFQELLGAGDLLLGIRLAHRRCGVVSEVSDFQGTYEIAMELGR